MNHRESLEQRAYVDWARMHPVARAFFAIPNGGKRSRVEAAIMKAEGVLAGAADGFLPVRRLCNGEMLGGLFIEFKFGSGRLSVDQVAFAHAVTDNGYAFIVAYDADAAIQGTLDYLAGNLPSEIVVMR